MRDGISKWEWRVVVSLLLLAFLLRTIDLTGVPPGLHNDEVAGIKITASVASGRLAFFFPEDTGHEASYYYYVAPLTRIFGTSIFVMRLLSVFPGLIGMCVIWALSRRLFGPVVATTALAGFAIVFWTVEFGRIILRVVLLLPLASLSAYCFWRARSAGGRRALVLWALSGLWLGLSINTYTAARILPAILVAFGAYVFLVDRGQWRRWWGGIGLTLIVAAVIVMPLFLSLAQNPAVDQFSFFDIDRPLAELRQGNLAPVIETALDTLGMFAFTGDPLPYMDVPGRPVFEPLGALLLGAGLAIALWRWRQPRYAFILLWFVCSLVPGMLSQPAPNYARTLGVQVVLFVFPGIAIDALLLRRRDVTIFVVLAVLFIGNVMWTARDYFTVWPNLESVRFWHQSGLKAAADQLQEDASTSPVVICVPDHLIDERDPWWQPAWQHMRYLLRRPDLSLRYYNCADTMVFIDGPARYAFPDAADVQALEHFPAFSQVLAGADLELEFLPDRLGIIARGDALASQSSIAAVLSEYLARIATASTVNWAPESGAAGQEAQLPVHFQDKVEFLGYSVSSLALDPGDAFDLVTFWRVTGDLPPQLAQFTHLLRADGSILTQQDRLALTSANLRKGDVFAQRHHLTLPTDVEAGEYPLSIGLYTLPDGARLRIAQTGQPRGDRLWLRPITVKP